MKYYCLLIQFIIWKQSCQTRRCFSYLLPYFSLCRSRTQKLADCQIACQCVFCYFIFIKITVQRQRKSVPRFYPSISTPWLPLRERMFWFIRVIESGRHTTKTKILSGEISFIPSWSSVRIVRNRFEIMRVFFVFSLHAFDFLKLMARISTQYNYSEEQLCGIEELIKFYVDSFHYEHRVLLY